MMSFPTAILPRLVICCCCLLTPVRNIRRGIPPRQLAAVCAAAHRWCWQTTAAAALVVVGLPVIAIVLWEMAMWGVGVWRCIHLVVARIEVRRMKFLSSASGCYTFFYWVRVRLRWQPSWQKSIRP
jgi:hypothetical protein